uniref:Putative secreted protein n=1 Tax=Ixodes ricinus TaxID=34613 RepID=A0A6B0U0H6_IXORI
MYILYLMFLSFFFFLTSSLCQGNLSACVLRNIHRLRFEAQCSGISLIQTLLIQTYVQVPSYLFLGRKPPIIQTLHYSNKVLVPLGLKL